MALAMNVPDLIYVFLSMFQPDNIWLIAGGVVLEQFGYGFGYTAFTLYLIYFSQGEYKTGHYALCTGLMAMGMMLAGLVSGYAQEWLGYELFFIWVCVCTIPGIILIKFLDIPENFGRKAELPEQK
jgi:PAT family beta-lactamase induction signal transducer AmpG